MRSEEDACLLRKHQSAAKFAEAETAVAKAELQLLYAATYYNAAHGWTSRVALGLMVWDKGENKGKFTLDVPRIEREIE